MMVPGIFRFLPLGKDFEGKRLIVVQLSGGNDWLNTIVPFENDEYYKARPNIGQAKNTLIRLSDELGLNPSLSTLQALYDEGEVAVFNGVGYPEPNRSHFRSMDIWHTAADGRTHREEGWLGRYTRLSQLEFPAIEMGAGLSLAMKANRGKSLAMEDLNGIKRVADDKVLRAIAATPHSHSNHTASYLYETALRVCEGADYLAEKLNIGRQTSPYPDNPLATDLSTIATLIKAGAETKIFYTSLVGFDTHARQESQHSRLLNSLGSSLGALRNDLAQANQWKNTLVIVFSEFGRRVAENAGRGTDHGTAGNVILLGGSLREPGIRGEIPSLVKLDQGDLIFHTDFRTIYSGILENWLETSSQNILGGNFAPVVI